MRSISIFNHVLGPVMRGPSSSHTAGAFHIVCMARSLMGGPVTRAIFAFDPLGSYAATYAQQGADRAFAMGLMGKPLTDEAFFTVLEDARAAGIEIAFEVRPLDDPQHPNAVDVELTAAEGPPLRLRAHSIGGGEVEIVRVADWAVRLDGSAWETLVEVAPDRAQCAGTLLGEDGKLLGRPAIIARAKGGPVLVLGRRSGPLDERCRAGLMALDGESSVWQSQPVYFVQTGKPLFTSAAELADQAAVQGVSLGRLALEYESQLLGLSQADVLGEMLRRYDIMVASAQAGLAKDFTGLQLLTPCAGDLFAAEGAGHLPVGGPHARAAARAMAVMHVDGAMGVVCAAPTGGSAGTIPGTLITLAELRKLDREQVALALLAAGAVGVIVAARATFAAEVAGCQVEIGAAGAMAAAAVVDASGGSAAAACHAAAIAFQNTMGSVCDLLHGMVEIPCHTRNAAAAASAFVCADMVLGGYRNPIALDETIDAVLAVGRMMPPELRCTSRGGLAVAPSARALRPCSRECRL